MIVSSRRGKNLRSSAEGLVADVVQAARSSFVELPITSLRAATAGQLPMHHRDPFDRMVIAQGQEEECTVVTPDDKFPLYNVDVMDC